MRYLLASNSQVSYGIESTAYSQASSSDTYFGLIREDVEPPNPNPQTPMATGGERRGPHVNSPDPKEFSWEIPCHPIDQNVPFEIALGKRATTTGVDPDGNAGSGDEYDEYLFVEQDRLPTATIAHFQDGQLEAYYTGCKASLDISASQGEAVTTTFNVTAAGLSPTTAASGSPASPPDLAVPQITPYRFSMLRDVDITLSSDGSSVKSFGTANSLEASWDNGLTSNNHGNGRDPYSISEETSEEKYDMTVGATLTDMDLYDRAYNDAAPVDVEFIFDKEFSATDITDSLHVRLLRCTVLEGPSPSPGEGKVEADIGLAPTNTEIEIRRPV